jgi:prepilin-type N-terminal cleavage/methylation domain-containing protein
MKRKIIRGSGFTLIELLIVMVIIEVLAVPLIGFFVFPFRVHATLSEANDTTAACGRMLNHLADDVRCADSISIVKEVGDRDELSALDNLSIQRGGQTVLYRKTLDNRIIREIEGEIPLRHAFEGCDAEFSIDTSGRYQTVRVEVTLDYTFLRGSVRQHRTAIFCSNLETGS